MTSTDASATHPLSLKVMRVSRPEAAPAWQPFYSSSPSFSAHSSASIISLQGSVPLTAHPKTLRDLTHASELLTLPATFGSIQLGETFASCLCVNNEASIEIDDVDLKVEIQTQNSKVLLAEFGGLDHRLRVGGSLECVVSHEIKELGQHVLACSVTYRLPAGARSLYNAAEAPGEPGIRTFRKFYKFVVSNPLSVKTKVHLPRAPSALTDPAERDKVFLEIHVQNVAQHALHLERIYFESEEDWQAKDGNVIAIGEGQVPQESIFSGSMTLIQPQDTRQYIYILIPKTTTLFPVAYTPGSVVPLGRLNISWRSSSGEPGRLLTSMLSRRIPPVQQQQASALPTYLKRNVAGSYPSRPQSPQLPLSRPSTPPPQGAISPPTRAQLTRHIPSLLPIQTTETSGSGIEVALLVKHIPRNEVVVEKPFTVKFALAVSSSGVGRRVIRIAVQQLRTSRTLSIQPTEQDNDISSPRVVSSGLNTPTSAIGSFNYAIAHQKLSLLSRTPVEDMLDANTAPQQQGTSLDDSENPRKLPHPSFERVDRAGSAERASSAVYVGASTLFLPEVTLGTEFPGEMESQGIKSAVVQEFEVIYVPLREGFVTFGGIRALLIEDRLLSPSSTRAEDEPASEQEKKIQSLKEWDTVGEIWVAS